MSGLFLSAIFWIIVKDKSPDHSRNRHITSSKISLFKSMKQVFTSSQSWWLSIYSGFAFAPVMVFGGLWGVSFITQSFNLSQGISAQMVSLIFIGFAIGALIFGWFSNWIGRRRIVMLWGTSISLIAISTIIYTPHIFMPLLSTLLFVFGFSISSFLLCFTMIREINLPILAATAIGFMNAFDAFLGAFSDLLAGKILDMFWSRELINGARVFSTETYKIAFLTIPIYLLVSLLILIKIEETHCKPTYPTSLP